MSRLDFMRELESLLSDIPIEERNEAIQYYNDYFEDAGEDHEEEIIKELGSPARIAGIIKADLNLSGEDHENRGYFTEKGYQDTVYSDEKYEIIKTAKPAGEEKKAGSTGSQSGTYSQSNANSQSNGTGTGNGTYQYGNSNSGYQNSSGAGTQKTSNPNMALLILLAIFAIPIGIPLFFGIFGTVIGIVASIFGVVIGFGAAGVALVSVGVALFIIGIVQINIPFALFVLCGSGLLVFGLGVLFLLSSVMLCKKLLPAIIRGFVNLCRLPFKNRRVTA